MGVPPVIIHFILAFSMKEPIQLLGIPDPETHACCKVTGCGLAWFLIAKFSGGTLWMFCFKGDD
jgi:hypothetical protein